ncbi:MAG: protein kinase [Sandaracinaceae bacterium]
MSDDADEARDLYLGRLIDGRYRVERCLGAGGMGSVYEAEQVGMGRKVALKILHVQLAKDPNVLRRFKNEARASATLGHPNIAQAFDFGRTEDGAPFIAMELLRGRNLAEVIAEEGALAFDRAIAITDRIADALDAAHAAGIVHRDVKPENVLLLDGDAVKVLDFGISKFNDGTSSVATRTGTFLGSPTYMAPEQVKDASRADARTDVYALGAVLYAMLTGRPMFSESSLPMLIIAITHDPPPPIASLRPDVSPALAALVARLTDKLPDRRPQTMADVRAELASIGEVGEGAPPIVARAEPLPREVAESRVELPTSRRPALLGLFAVAAVGALGVGAYATWGADDEPNGDTTPALPATALEERTLAEPDAGIASAAIALPPEEPTRVETARTEPSEPASEPPGGRRRGRADGRNTASGSTGARTAEPTGPNRIDGVPIDDTY